MVLARRLTAEGQDAHAQCGTRDGDALLGLGRQSTCEFLRFYRWFLIERDPAEVLCPETKRSSCGTYGT
jgi:hypothetical protein